MLSLCPPSLAFEGLREKQIFVVFLQFLRVENKRGLNAIYMRGTKEIIVKNPVSQDEFRLLTPVNTKLLKRDKNVHQQLFDF